MNVTKQEITLHINREDRIVTIRFADTLLDTLRMNLGLTSARPGCENGDCGACTILVDDIPYKSCIMLAVEAVDHRVTTVEGLENAPIQSAFAKCYAFQCGYCTPGFIMNTHAMLCQHKAIDDDIIREWLESNICRCTSYEEIGTAVRMANQMMTESRKTDGIDQD